MRTILFLLAIMLSSFVNAQKIEVNEIDDFSGVRSIETKYFRPQKEKLSQPLVVIKFGSSNNIPYLQWHSRYVNLHVVEGSILTLLDDSKNKYEFHCIRTDRKGLFRYIGDFDAILDKKISKYRIQTFSGYADFDVDNKRSELISSYYMCLKAEVEKYFNGIINMGEVIKAANDPGLSSQEKIDILLKQAPNSGINSGDKF